MIVVAIIGILAAIAVPQLAKMREKGYDSAAKSALGNLKTAQEAYYLENNRYATTGTALEEFYKPETDVVVTLTTDANTTPPSYVATAKHNGSQNTWAFDSKTGQITKQ